MMLMVQMPMLMAMRLAIMPPSVLNKVVENVEGECKEGGGK